MATTTLLVFIVYFAVVISVGVYFTRRASRDYDEFMIGERKIGPWATSLSAISAFMSGYTYTAAPGLGYRQGFSALWWSLGESPANSLGLGLLGRRLRRITQLIDAISMPEFYEKHFTSTLLRALTSIILIFLIGMYLVAQWVASGTLLVASLGVSYTTGMIIVAAIVLAYTVLGGYLAVIYTDVIQFVIMFFGTQLFFWIAMFEVGGLNGLTAELAEIDRNLVTPWGPNLMYYGLLAALTPVFLITLGGFGLPHLTMRHISMRSPEAARQAMLITAVVVILFSFVYYLIGPLALAYFGPGIENVEQVGFRLWYAVLPPVLAGVLSSAALAAIMGTASSFLILLVTTVGHDVLYRFAMRRSPEPQRILIARLLVGAITIITFIIAINPPGLVFQIVIAAYGALALAFGIPNLFTVFWRRTTKVGVISCMILSLVVYVGMSLTGWAPFGLDPFILGLIVALVSIMLGSWIGGNPRNADQLAVFDKGASYEHIPPQVSAYACSTFSDEVIQALELVGQKRGRSGWQIGSPRPRTADG
jgi:sodium/proline symporter